MKQTTKQRTGWGTSSADRDQQAMTRWTIEEVKRANAAFTANTTSAWSKGTASK